MPARRVTSSSIKGEQNLSEMEDNEADRLDTAWDLRTNSRLGCQAVIKGDVVVEFPMYTRNYVQEGGGIQLGKSDRKDEDERRRWRDEVDRRRGHRHRAGRRRFPAIDPLTVRFTDLREKVMQLDGFDDDPKTSNEPKLEAIQMAWYEEWKENQ